MAPGYLAQPEADQDLPLRPAVSLDGHRGGAAHYGTAHDGATYDDAGYDDAIYVGAAHDGAAHYRAGHGRAGHDGHAGTGLTGGSTRKAAGRHAWVGGCRAPAGGAGA